MRCQRMVVVASLFAVGSEAYAPIQMVTGPAKGLVFLPKGGPESIRGIVTPQKLSVGISTASDAQSMTPYFTAKLDQTIRWDDMDWCVEAAGDKSGDAIRMNQCNGGHVQKWVWIPCGEGSNRIQLKNTNLCMDADDQDVGPNGSPIALRDCGKEVTRWKFEELISLHGGSAHDSLPYEARHVLITLMTLVGLGAVSVGAWLWQRGEKKQQGSMPSSVDQELAPAMMFVNPMRPSGLGQSCAARHRSRNLVLLANRFYVKEPFKEGSEVTLTGEELHHLSRVMRKKEGEKVELVNGLGFLAEATIRKLDKREALLSIVEATSHEPQVASLTLVQALPKISHLELIIQKGTELGVSSFHIFPSKLSEKKELSDNQRKRLEQICIGAMKQCGRLDLPDINFAANMQSLNLPGGHAYFGDPQASQPLLGGNAPYLLFIGPEAGFTDKEYESLKELFHAEGVRLHPYILRAETAAIAAITIAAQ